ncbi:MAG: PAS domain S-box protein [Methanocella sp.]
MGFGPLIFDSEKDKHKTRGELLDELSELRAQLATKTEDLARCDRVYGMLDGITEPVLALDDESHVVYANSAAVRLFAKDGEAIEGMSLWDLYPTGQGTLFYNAYEKARTGRSAGKFRVQHRPLGKWFDVYLYPVPGGMTVLFQDITVSRQMEELPRLALTLLHNLKDIVFLLRADGRLFHVNNETKDSLGYSSDQLHKMSIFDVVPSTYASQWHDILNRTRLHGSMTFESRLLARDSHEFPVEVYANYIELYGNSYYTISARDITERMQAEQERALLASIVHTAHEGIISLTPEGIITSWNKWAEELYGYTADEAIGNNAAMLAPPDRQSEIAGNIEKLRRDGQTIYYETVRQRKDGTLIDISLTLSPIVDSSGAFVGLSSIVHDISERKRIEEALARSEKDFRTIVTRNVDAMIILDVEGYVQYVNPRVESLYNLPASDMVGQLFGFPLLLEDPVEMYVLKEFKEFVAVEMRMVEVEWQGKPSFLLTLQDITERKKAAEAVQVARAQAELYVDLMGHDINNMNMVAMGSLELVLMEMDEAGKLDISSKPLLDKSLESLNNSSSLIRNVQKLQRASVEGIRLQAVDVADVLKGIIDEQRSTPGNDVTIYYKNKATHCLVTANELLRDVFTNIISNAIKHAKADRHLTIGVTVESVVEDGKKFCRVAIDDNGPGIPDEVKDRLFRRFSRGETKARGTGLGLFLVKTLVEHYGGQIRIEDRVPGDFRQGAKFVVIIPSAG